MGGEREKEKEEEEKKKLSWYRRRLSALLLAKHFDHLVLHFESLIQYHALSTLYISSSSSFLFRFLEQRTDASTKYQKKP